MTEEALTFSDLRKIQKQEKRQDKLSELDDNFLLKVSEYLDRKKDVDNREYKNAKRVLDKIIGLRQDKIVKNAKISVKSDVKRSKLNLLPREKEFYRDVKNKFNSFSDKIDDVVEQDPSDVEKMETGEIQPEPEPEEDEREVEDGYELVKIVSDVPEFMGTDLESYGPFDEGEEVELPEENADILVNRGSAEKVES
jgi:DNA replication initiation complex subunit (GINS family)